MSVTYLHNKSIDRSRWDEAVGRDPSCLPYGLSWWLDAACADTWDGFIFDDYRAVIPLPRGPFWARTRVQRPFFTQQCGPFGEVRPGDLADFFAALPAHARSCVLPLTATAKQREVPAKYQVNSRANYVLDLSPGHAAVFAGYHKDLRRKIRKCAGASVSPITPEELLLLYRETSGEKSGLKEKHYTHARAIMKACLSRNAGICRSLKDADGELLAAIFLPRYRKRLINLLPASTPAGRRHNAMARLLDAVIEEHAGPGWQFDFEGSDLPGIAQFFRYFGPKPQPYLSVE